MERRDALKALAGIAASTGMTVIPVSTQEARDAALIVLRVRDPITSEGAVHLRNYWVEAVSGTPLEHVKTVVMHEGIDLQVIRK